MKVNIDYQDFINIVDSKGLSVQYYETSDRYYIFTADGEIGYETSIVKNASSQEISDLDATQEEANQSDFETNYKDSANKQVGPDVITEDGTNYLRTKTTVGSTVTGEIYGWDIYPSGWVELGGSITSGDIVTITIDGYDSSYTVQTSDEWSDIVDGLVTNINDNTNVNTKVKAFSQHKLVFIRAQERGDKYDGLILSASVSTDATVTADANHTELAFYWKEILVEEDDDDKRYGRIGVFGEVGSRTKAENPIHITVKKNIATTSEVVFADKDVPSNTIWYITNIAVADGRAAEFLVYHGLERNRNETFTGDGSTTTFTLDYNAVGNEDYIDVVTDGSAASFGGDYELKQNDDDEKKTDIIFSSAPSTSVDVTYDTTKLSLGLFVVENTSQDFEFGAPIKLDEGEFLIASVKNKASNAATALLNINGFTEEIL